MNYTTHAIEYINNCLKEQKDIYPIDSDTSLAIVELLRSAPKFLLPHNGNIGVNVNGDCISFIRLPYETIVFEFDAEIESYISDEETHTETLKNVVSKIILLVTHDEDYLAIFPISCVNNRWIASNHSIMIEKDSIHYDESKKNTTQVQYRLKVVFSNFYNFLLENYSEEELERYSISDYQPYIDVVINALIAMNAKNVQTVTLEAPEKLNNKRLKNNKEPFYDYHVLSIFCGKEILLKRPRDRVKNALKAGVSLHTVRGHFKNRNGKLFWWSNHLRGDKRKGIVEKDYKLLKE